MKTILKNLFMPIWVVVLLFSFFSCSKKKLIKKNIEGLEGTEEFWLVEDYKDGYSIASYKGTDTDPVIFPAVINNKKVYRIKKLDLMDHLFDNKPNYIFFDEDKIISVDLSKSIYLEEIGDEIFSKCEFLSDIIFPNSLISIGNSVFLGCSSLKNIKIPLGLVSIGEFSFYFCSSLESIDIPNGTVSIGKRSFDGCDVLKKVKIPHSVEYIGDEIFSSNNSIDTLYLPKKFNTTDEKSRLLIQSRTVIIEVTS